MISDSKPTEGSPPSYTAPNSSGLGPHDINISQIPQNLPLLPPPEKQAHPQIRSPAELTDLGKDYQAQRMSRATDRYNE
jgi:hypothetical protein